MNTRTRARTPRGRASLRALLLIVVVTLVAAACGGDDTGDDTTTGAGAATETSEDASPADSPTPTGTAAEAEGTAADDAAVYPVSVSADNGEVTIGDRPGRIVSLSPTATEMLFAIGAGDLVVAADQYSNYPAGAPTTELSGFEPNLEAILEFEPDLVVASSGPEELVDGLGSAGVPVIVQDAAANLDEAYSQMETLGVATGNVAGAAEVVANMQSDIADIVAGLETPAEPVSYYHELDPSHFTVTSGTFIGEVYGLLGMESIADPAAESGTAYPQLNEEFIVEADPDVILLADTKCCAVTAERVSERPGWDSITAVRNGAIIELDDDVASRWGPRIVELLRRVADEVAALEPAA